MRHNDIREGETYHFVATTDPVRQHLEGRPFLVSRKVDVWTSRRVGRKRHRYYNPDGDWADPEELEPIPDNPCSDCQVGEMQQVGGTSPNGTTRYRCAVCGRTESFP